MKAFKKEKFTGIVSRMYNWKWAEQQKLSLSQQEVNKYQRNQGDAIWYFYTLGYPSYTTHLHLSSWGQVAPKEGWEPLCAL